MKIKKCNKNIIVNFRNLQTTTLFHHRKKNFLINFFYHPNFKRLDYIKIKIFNYTIKSFLPDYI